MDFSDLTGKTFGDWYVIKRGKSDNTNHARYWCKCNCGNENCKGKKLVRGFELRNGRSNCCGAKNGSHGFYKHSLYTVWCSMKQRCYNKNSRPYKNYGGRGIKICKEWQDNPGKFIKWSLDNGWKEGLEIDRENNNKNYSPKNCRFVTHSKNQSNKRDNRRLTYKEKTKTVSQWARDKTCVISERTLRTRIRRGWKISDALIMPVQGKSVEANSTN